MIPRRPSCRPPLRLAAAIACASLSATLSPTLHAQAPASPALGASTPKVKGAKAGDAAKAAQAAKATTPTANATRPDPMAHWQQGPFMEVFVRSYQDSDGDGVGDLKGLISRLDVLQALGIRGLWLMPIQRSADRDHGYATTDYFSVEPDYGSMDDVRTLLKEAHARGIGVIIDHVINHSSHLHPFFQDALRGGPHCDWYVWQPQAPQGWDIWGKDPWHARAPLLRQQLPMPREKGQPPEAPGPHYFATFGAPMPDFNFRHPAVVKYHEDVLRRWLDLGLDGFRFDAVPHLVEKDAKDWNDQPESRRLSGHFTRLVHTYPNRYVVCEATAEPAVYGRPEHCGAAFAFGIEREYVGLAKGDTGAIDRLIDKTRTLTPGMATFISNHDIFAGPRLWDQVAGDEAAYKLAATAYLLGPGTPYIYYGEEIGMAGAWGLQGDGPIRSPMSWDNEQPFAGFSTRQPYRPVSPNRATHHLAAQMKDPASIWHHYRRLSHLRQAEPALRSGALGEMRREGALLAMQRLAPAGQGQDVWVLINAGGQPASWTPPGPGRWLSQDWPGGAPQPVTGGAYQVPARSSAVWRAGR